MKRTMFIGAIACGKTTLTQRLENQQIKYNKTQAIEFSSNIIDTCDCCETIGSGFCTN